MKITLPSKTVLYKGEHVTKEYKLHSSYFSSQKRTVTALQNIEFEIPQQSLFGIVGQSGSGKSTLMRLLVGLETPTQGNIHFFDTNTNNTIIDNTQETCLSAFTKQQLQLYQTKVKMIFQDPARSLNHRLSVETILLDSLRYSPFFTQLCKQEKLFTWKTKKQLAFDIIYNTLQLVDFDVPNIQHMVKRYPSDFSGGQRQRIAIARALIHNPHVIICDEITSSLDAQTRKTIANMLVELHQTKGITILFITHDLALVTYLCDIVMVMKDGTIVDTVEYTDILSGTISDDTKELLNALPPKI